MPIMMYTVVLLSVWLSLSLGNTVTPRYVGCYSTSFVKQYAEYYRYNYHLSIQRGIALCSNRLTRYMGLEAETESPGDHNFVYCGNDLAEVSPKVRDGECDACKKNRTLPCGKKGTMSVYWLRESTPLSLLLATDSGVQILSNNKTTSKIDLHSTSPHKFVDYTYIEDMIVSAIGSSFYKSFYDPMQKKFSYHKQIFYKSHEALGLAVDFLTQYLYYGYAGDKLLHRSTTFHPYNETPILSSGITYFPEQISIDPYNRSLVFLVNSTNTINILLLNEEKGRNLFEISLNHLLKVDKISALSMDSHHMLLYAILTLQNDSSTYLYSFDYEVSQMQMLFSGPQLENAKRLEVFRDDAVWLSDISGLSTVFQCTLMATEMCKLENYPIYQSNQKIYDFTIYHPEKQTPGRKRNCANKNYCSHGCELFSPFTAKCVCPRGLKINPDNSTCARMPTSSTIPTNTLSDELFNTTRSVSGLIPDQKYSIYPFNSSVTKHDILSLSSFSILGFVALLVLIAHVMVFNSYRDSYTQQGDNDSMEP